jgi:hypothetical protein
VAAWEVMAGRGCASVVVLVMGGCGPGVDASPSDGPGGTTTSVGTGPSSVGTSTTSGSADSVGDGTADSVGDEGCPDDPCAVDEYCDDALQCRPLPDVLPDCAPDRLTVTAELVVEGPAQPRGLGLADVDGAGEPELVVLEQGGEVEIRTIDLSPLSTTLLQSAAGEDVRVASAIVTTAEGDGFGRVFVSGGLGSDRVEIFTVDGVGGFVAEPPAEVGHLLAMAADDWDDDGDSDLAVVTDVGDGGQILMFTAGEGGFTDEQPRQIDASPRSVAGGSGAGARDLLVGTSFEILRFPGDGAGGFGSPSALPIEHTVNGVGEFRIGGDTGLVAIEGYKFQLQTLVRANGVPRVWPARVIAHEMFAIFGDPSSDGDLVFLPGLFEDALVIVDPGAALPCGVALESPRIRAILADSPRPILAAEDQLIRIAIE